MSLLSGLLGASVFYFAELVIGISPNRPVKHRQTDHLFCQKWHIWRVINYAGAYTANGNLAYKRPDNVLVVPIGTLGV